MNKFEKVMVVLIILVIGMVIGALYNENKEEILGFIILKKPMEGNISFGCENLSLSKTVNCLVRNVRPFYKYNRTEGNVPFSLEEIKEHGGDCWDYSYLYSEAAKELGFGYRYLKYPMNEKESHIFLIIYDEGGYCLIDQLKSVCAKIE